jgi:hypothetical protein
MMQPAGRWGLQGPPLPACLATSWCGICPPRLGYTAAAFLYGGVGCCECWKCWQCWVLAVLGVLAILRVLGVLAVLGYLEAVGRRELIWWRVPARWALLLLAADATVAAGGEPLL